MQTTKRVLIVPFNRFSFQSEFSLIEIAGANQFEGPEAVYHEFRKEVVKTISYNDGAFSFFELPLMEQSMIDQRVQRLYKTKPITHFGVDISDIQESGQLKNLLDNFSADYILFMSRYEIAQKTLIAQRSFDGSNIYKWSYHKLNYEIYDSEGRLICLSGGMHLDPKFPTQETYTSSGLLLSDMEKAYFKLREDMVEKIKRYQGEPIYR